MERVAGDVERGHLGVAEWQLRRVHPRQQAALAARDNLHRRRSSARKKRHRQADPEKYRVKRRERRRLDPAFRERQAKRAASARNLALRRLRYIVDGGRRKARAAKRRATKLSAIPANADVLAINRAYAKLSRRAKALGMAIDRVVSPAPCRTCSARGAHNPRNWQLLSNSDNRSKGNRCQRCWKRDMLSKSLPDRRRKSAKYWSGQRDSNPRPPAPKAGALPS